MVRRIGVAVCAASLATAVFAVVRLIVLVDAPALDVPALPATPKPGSVVALAEPEPGPAPAPAARPSGILRPAAAESRPGGPILVAAPAARPSGQPQPKAGPTQARRAPRPAPKPSPAPAPAPAPAPRPAPGPERRVSAAVVSAPTSFASVKTSPGREKQGKGPAPGQLRHEQPEPQPEGAPEPAAEVAPAAARPERPEHPHGGPPGQAKKDEKARGG